MPAREVLPSGLVTLLFTDIEGSTRLAQMLGGAYRPVLATHRQLLRGALRANGGVEMFVEGDSSFYVFPAAGSAVRGCYLAQRAIAGHPWPARPDAAPRIRMGLHTGWVRPQAGEYASPEVHRAARIAAAAHGGQVLCSAATAHRAGPAGLRLRELGWFRLRGFDRPERLYQLVAPGLAERFPRPRTDDPAAGPLPYPLGVLLERTLREVAAGCATGGDAEVAARLLGAVAAHFGGAPPEAGKGRRGDPEAVVRGVLGDRAFETAYASGAALSLADAAELALAVDRRMPAELAA